MQIRFNAFNVLVKPSTRLSARNFIEEHNYWFALNLGHFIQGPGVDMPSLRAFNQLSDSPLKLIGDRTLSDGRLRPKNKTNEGKDSARPLAAVLIPHKETNGRIQNKSNIEQVVAKAQRLIQDPKTRKNSDLSTSKNRRQQAPREKKLVYSIEHSPQNMTGSFTPEHSTHGVEGSDYIPSPPDLSKTDQNSASITPSRRRARKHRCRCPNSRSNAAARSTSSPSPPKMIPPDNGRLTFMKRENSPTLTPTVMAKPPSPSIYSSQLRRKRYEEAEIVELPKEVYEYKKARKEMRQQLAAKKKVMRARKRKERAKLAGQRSIKETHKSTKKTKRRPENEVEQNEPRKRQKSSRSEKPGPEHHSITDDGKVFSEEPQTSKRTSAQRASKGMTTEKQAQRYNAVVIQAEDRSDINDLRSHPGIEARSEGSKKESLQHLFSVGAEAQGFQLYEEPLGQSGNQAWGDGGQRKRSLHEGWRKRYKRREILEPQSSRHCSCSMLPKYFTENPKRIPRLATWIGCKHEFVAHVRRIYFCGGSIHPPHVVSACKKILERNDYPKRRNDNSFETVLKSAQGGNKSISRRAQSSIPPPVFYGNDDRHGHAPDTGSSSRSVPEVKISRPSLNSHSTSKPVQQPKDVSSGCTPSMTLPVQNKVNTFKIHADPPLGQSSRPAVANNSTNYIAPPNSSPLDQRRGAGTPSDLHEADYPPSGQENVGVRRISKPLPEVFSGLDRPQSSFDTRRQRHQSVPVKLLSRGTAVDERNSLALLAPHQLDIARSDNTILSHITSLNRSFEQFSATLLTQITGIQPAPAPASAPASVPSAAAQGESRTEAPAGRKRKRPSLAERLITKPKLSRDVPEHLRLSDEAIIRIGRIRNSYERHRKAPQAFSWGGGLYREYDHLLVRTVDGVTVWTAAQIKRLSR